MKYDNKIKNVCGWRLETVKKGSDAGVDKISVESLEMGTISFFLNEFRKIFTWKFTTKRIKLPLGGLADLQTSPGGGCGCQHQSCSFRKVIVHIVADAQFTS